MQKGTDPNSRLACDRISRFHTGCGTRDRAVPGRYGKWDRVVPGRSSSANESEPGEVQTEDHRIPEHQGGWRRDHRDWRVMMSRPVVVIGEWLPVFPDAFVGFRVAIRRPVDRVPG